MKNVGRYRTGSVACCLVGFAVVAAAQPVEPTASPVETTVGVSSVLSDVILPGSELEPIPVVDQQQPVVIRIKRVSAHGDAFRYDLEFYVLDPGEFDLRDYLRRKDGSDLRGVPPLPVVVKPLLPAGQVQPHSLAHRKSPRVGFYRATVALLAIGWFAGLFAMWWAWRSKSRRAAGDEVALSETFRNRLQEFAKLAEAGQLDEPRLAEMERVVIAYWSRRLQLEQLPPREVHARLMQHPQAGPVLRQLEEQLHHPSRRLSNDLAQLLYSLMDAKGVTS